MGRLPPIRRRRLRGHSIGHDSDPPHLQGNQPKPYHLSLLRRPQLLPLPLDPLANRRIPAPQAAERRFPLRFRNLRIEFALRLRSQPRRLPAGRKDLGFDHERRRSRQGLAADCILVVGDQGYGDAGESNRLWIGVSGGGILQPLETAGAEGEGGAEEASGSRRGGGEAAGGEGRGRCCNGEEGRFPSLIWGQN